MTTKAGGAVVLVVEKVGEEGVVSKQGEKSGEEATEQQILGSPSFSIFSDSPPSLVNAKGKEDSNPHATELGPPPIRTISRAMFSKQKSRFFEMNHPVDDTTVLMRTSHHSQAFPATATTPQGSPKSARGAPAGEEEEDEAYKPDVLEEKRNYKITARRFLEWMAFILITASLICSLTVPRFQDFSGWGLELWKWCLMVLVVLSGRLVSGWIVSLLVFMIERNFMLRTRVLYFVYGMRRSVQVSIWMGLALLSWTLLFDHSSSGGRKPRRHQFLSYVTRSLSAILVGALLWMVKTLLVKALASSFHVNAYFDRIQESVFNQYVLATLSGPPLMELQEKVGRSESSGKLSVKVEGKKGKDVDVIDVKKLQRIQQDKVSAWTMKRLANVISNSGLSTISATIDDSVSSEDGKNEGQINSEAEARTVAYTIFRNVARPDSKYIDEEDLLRFLSKEDVQKILPQFAGAAELGKVKKSAFRKWVVNAYLERKSLAHSLNDTKTAVKQLHKLANCMVILVNLVVWLLFMGFATSKVLLFISSQLLLLGFMFGNTCKIIFESIIFVFVMHPFDVGDRCVIDGVQMIVEEMNILNTVFLRYDNEKIYYPNAVLITKPISNFYRSPDMGDSVEFSIDVSTPVETLGALKARIQMYLEGKPQHWHPKHSVVVKEIENINKMKIGLYVMHTMNHQNYGEKNLRRSDLVVELKKIFEELGIKYHLLPQEVRLVTHASSGVGRVFY
ncbi:mechanosensitive ion channel protein 10 isoform X2 [Nymphaea colorata]|nr:mechanosensitive ion channel protein 10 isoform X2 [Nymphaea colorata]XP_031497076.1 mechanosensitive ion channel protein 10 isoform X2 [Nymphaea colorata]